MRINSHAHIFTLQTVLTSEAVSILIGRIKRLGAPGFLVEAVQSLIEDALDHPRYLSEDELLRKFLKSIGRSDAFKSIMDSNSLPIDIQIIGRGLDDLSTSLLHESLNRLSARFDEVSDCKTGVRDIYETLRLALKSHMVDIADEFLQAMGPEDAIVALMMDITAANESDRDATTFERQLKETQETILMRPGRVLPFVAVNPKRPNHFALMKQGVEDMGFVGVKLYPSLGYDIASNEMKRVLAYCAESDTPIVVHCNQGGFYKNADSTDFAHPRHWKQYDQRQVFFPSGDNYNSRSMTLTAVRSF